MNKKTYVVLATIFVLILAGISFAQDTGELPELVLIDSPGLHPEGIEWDAQGGRFLVGSLTMGGIYEVADDGTTTPFIEHEQFISTVGIHIDAENNRLLVANGDVFRIGRPDGTAQLGIFDLQTGEALHFVELSDLHDGPSFANDVVNDVEGNAYVTDTRSPVIYKVDINCNAEVFVESENFAVDGIGLNGIEYHENGYLLVAVHGAGKLYKVPLDDPSSMSVVEVSEPVSIDGMVLDEEGHLVAVTSEIIVLSSDDDWATAEIIDRGIAMPEAGQATVALRDSHAFVVHARFGEMGSEPPAETFEIVRIQFEMGHNHAILSNAQETELPKTPLRIHFTSEALYPEGIAYDEVWERFLVSSLTQGIITAVYYEGSDDDYYNARTEVFIDDDDLVSAIGIHIDNERRRLFVANSDPGVSVKTSEDTQGVLAELAIYDLETGERLHLVDLDDLAPDDAHFANDMTYDTNGNVYVTDSFSPIIYKVDMDGNAEIFLEDERFTGEGFNLNGIVFHPDGYLIVTKFNEGLLFKIPLDDPSAFTEVSMEETFPGADGIVLMEDGRLFLADNQLAGDGVNQVAVLESDDDWASATVPTIFTMHLGSAPTTATRRGDTVHVLFGRLDVLFNPDTEIVRSDYQIVRADCCFP